VKVVEMYRKELIRLEKREVTSMVLVGLKTRTKRGSRKVNIFSVGGNVREKYDYIFDREGEEIQNSCGKLETGNLVVQRREGTRKWECMAPQLHFNPHIILNFRLFGAIFCTELM
jgi:hypothetical protein